MNNIGRTLEKRHNKQGRLLAALADTHGDSDKRKELFAAIRAELEHHAAAEQGHFYVPLMEYDLIQVKARYSMTEHHKIEELDSRRLARIRPSPD